MTAAGAAERTATPPPTALRPKGRDVETTRYPSATVRLDRVTKNFKTGARALDDVSIEATSGRILGLLGRNGAGKTTALRILMGLTQPSSGTASILGHAYTELRNGPRRVGTSFDGYGYLAGASGPRELSIWATMLGVSGSRVRHMLDLVDLRGAGHKPVKAYSTGMRQRLNLAIALLADPEVLILDEPANGLDPEGIRWLRDLLLGLAADGRSIIVSSHLLAEVEQTVQDVVVLQQSVRYSGSLADLTGDGRRGLETAFFDLLNANESSPEHAAAESVVQRAEG